MGDIIQAHKSAVVSAKKKYIEKGERGFKAVVYIFLAVFTLCMFFPFWLIVINSFATESSLAQNGFQAIPASFTLDGYKYMFTSHQVFLSYRNSIIITVVGTILAVFVTSTFAYVLAHPKAKYKGILSFLTYLAMLMGAGLVGFYIMVASWLNLKDTIWALILPYLLNPFFAFILVASYRSIPYEINEAACIDGANDIYIFFRIIWPISLPAIATIGLFYSLQYWNDWYMALLFIDDYKLHPLQMLIRQLISNINASSYVRGAATSSITVPTNTIKMVVVCVTIGPIILVYPFIQKYFVKGITVGAVKG
ncbi:MAG: carbohydrate ABC transporter permease [Clostridia bacterium]|nr:carbohydrate ABC transporter permease [Clostridia bacterium]